MGNGRASYKNLIGCQSYTKTYKFPLISLRDMQLPSRGLTKFCIASCQIFHKPRILILVVFFFVAFFVSDHN